MSQRPISMLRTLLGSLLLSGAVAMIIGVMIVINLVSAEYDELLDSTLTSKANLLLNILETQQDGVGPRGSEPEISSLLSFEDNRFDPDERTIFWFMDASGTVVVQSTAADPALLQNDIQDGVSTSQGYRFISLASSGSGNRLIVAAPLVERNHTITDVTIGAILGFALLGLLFLTAIYRTVRRSVGILSNLNDNIAQKNEHDLTPIDRRNSFVEIEPAIDTLDTLMSRLDAALAAERAFATNAAHELRTPVAICLAHVQRLRTTLKETAQTRSVEEIEGGLKRLVRLIERLLQMSRAQSGLGRTPVVADINPVIALMLRELHNRVPQDDRLKVIPPTGAWQSHIDPDALGIILNNLFDNALKYSSGATPVLVDAGTPGRIVIENDCDPLSSADLDTIKKRFIRKAKMSDGYGLGLSIVQALCVQSGCTLEIQSPPEAKARGFAAILIVPSA